MVDRVRTSLMLERMKRPEDRSMWLQFHERFHRPLLAFARRWGLPEAETDDVVQETLLAFVEAHRAGKYERTKGHVSSWLFGIAYQQIADRRRQLGRLARREARPGERFWEDVPERSEAEHAWDATWESSVLEVCLERARGEVAQKTFEAFRLVVREGRTPEAAGEVLGMTREAVYVAKHRVLKRLGEMMQEYEHFR